MSDHAVLVIVVLAILLAAPAVYLAGRPGGPLSPECFHVPPSLGYSVGEAHQEMQDLIECRVETCRAKAAARAVLIDAGHFVPDVWATR